MIPIPNTSLKLEEKVDHLLGSTAFISSSALADAGMTYANLIRNGIEYEGNPLLRSLIYETNLEAGLFAPKIIWTVFSIATATAMDTSSKYTGKGKYLLYGGGLTWAFGFLSNWWYY